MDEFSNSYYDTPIGMLKEPIDFVFKVVDMDYDLYDHMCVALNNPISNAIYSIYRPIYRELQDMPWVEEGPNV